MIRSALTQFAERGFDHVTVDEIAEACDVSPRTFFRYFGSKEDVLFGDSDENCARIVQLLHDRMPEEPLLSALRRAVLAVAGEYQNRSDLVVLRHRIVHDTPALQRRVAERSHSWERLIVEELGPRRRATAADELRLRLTVGAATTALRVAVDVWINRGGRGELTELLTEALDQLRRGLDA
ncbi:MAG: hypothetical protein QOJ00_2853 [Actinomycetota bacterium]